MKVRRCLRCGDTVIVAKEDGRFVTTAASFAKLCCSLSSIRPTSPRSAPAANALTTTI